MLYFYIFISLVIVLLLILQCKNIYKNRELLKQLREKENSFRELVEAHEVNNRNLELRIQEEIAANRQKDHFLIQHSRLASMGEMVASMGRQWSQPLNNLSLLVQDVREEFAFGVIDEQYIDRFIKESMVQINHMSRTIHDFRKFYTPSNEKSPFLIGNSIENALFIFSPSLTFYGIDVEFEYGGQKSAYGYPNEFSQVVLNILNNARDTFVQKAIRNPKIWIHLDETEEFVSAELIDNAGGMDDDVLNKIFDPFFTTKPNGTGLGLYMTKMIIENMNGQIKVTNTEHGASFCLSVPKVSVLEPLELAK